jgi:3'-phosphoadenosine 5'-phosphosulfate sulfotransferase (PAPS reductase)/FAD synthetase
MKIKIWELKDRQSLGLTDKISLSKQRIRDFYQKLNGKVVVSFSGGKDSTVMLHLIRSIYPNVKAVFVNTGLEWPEVVQFVRETENVEILKPEMTFKQVLDTYGYPVTSKKVATMIRTLQNPTEENKNERTLYLTGIRGDGKIAKGSWKIPKKWKFLVKAPFKISDQCCDVMKKNPFKHYTEKTGLHPYVATMASESRLREITYLQQGCNSFTGKIQSRPLSFWMEEDVWAYIKKYNLKYATIYDKGQLRTGCMFCMFGTHLEKEPNKFQCMANTHPQLWDYCINQLGLGKILDYVHVPYHSKEKCQILK